MVDVGPLFTLARSLAADAIRTAGTDVTLTPPAVVATDPVTLQRTTTTPTPVPSKAIVAQLTSAATLEPLPGIEVRAGDLKVVLPPTVDDPDPGTLVTVTRCRDPRLVGQTGKVLGCARSSAGAVLTVYARPARPS